MHGPALVARSNSTVQANGWAYHSRGNRHSKTACWAVLFDLLLVCPLLRQHVAEGRIAAGIEYAVEDRLCGGRRRYDLVLAMPLYEFDRKKAVLFSELADEFGMALTGGQRKQLEQLPALPMLYRPRHTEHPLRDLFVALALEAKAAMTELQKCRSRLTDGVVCANAGVRLTHPQAISAAYALVNVAEEFYSPVRNQDRSQAVLNRSTDAQVNELIAAATRLTRVALGSPIGVDAMGVTTVSSANDGLTAMRVVSHNSIPEHCQYARFIGQMAQQYTRRFSYLSEQLPAEV